MFIDAGVHYCVCVKKDLEVNKSVDKSNAVDNIN